MIIENQHLNMDSLLSPEDDSHFTSWHWCSVSAVPGSSPRPHLTCSHSVSLEFVRLKQGLFLASWHFERVPSSYGVQCPSIWGLWSFLTEIQDTPFWQDVSASSHQESHNLYFTLYKWSELFIWLRCYLWCFSTMKIFYFKIHVSHGELEIVTIRICWSFLSETIMTIMYVPNGSISIILTKFTSFPIDQY